MTEYYELDLSIDEDDGIALDVDEDENISMSLESAIQFIRRQGSVVYYDTKENWDAQSSLIAEEEALYIYTNRSYIEDGVGNRTPVPGIKVGDGTSYLIDMPFTDSDILSVLGSHVNDFTVHVTSAERSFWNNKVTVYLDDNDSEALIFSKN